MYMSPEQLSQDNGNHGYLGSAVDVWASGVLLIVMLVHPAFHWVLTQSILCCPYSSWRSLSPFSGSCLVCAVAREYGSR